MSLKKKGTPESLDIIEIEVDKQGKIKTVKAKKVKKALDK